MQNATMSRSNIQVRVPTTTPSSSPSLSSSLCSIQDLIALGEYSDAISTCMSSTNTTIIGNTNTNDNIDVKNNNNNNNTTSYYDGSKTQLEEQEEEEEEENNNSNQDDMNINILRRLPFFLRLLGNSRALATHYVFPTTATATATAITNGEFDKIENSIDNYSQSNNDGNIEEEEYINQIVSKLEIITAKYPQCENMEVLISHYIPNIVKNIMMVTAKSDNKQFQQKERSKRRNQLRRLKYPYYSIMRQSIDKNNILIETQDNNSKKNDSSSAPSTTILQQENNKNNHCHHSNTSPTIASSSSCHCKYLKLNQNGMKQQRQEIYHSPTWDTSFLQSMLDNVSHNHIENNMKKKDNDNDEHDDYDVIDKNIAIDLDYNNVTHGENCNEPVQKKRKMNDLPTTTMTMMTQTTTTTTYLTSNDDSTISTSTGSTIRPTTSIGKIKDEDTLESTVTQVLVDLISLIISSLKPIQLVVSSSPQPLQQQTPEHCDDHYYSTHNNKTTTIIEQQPHTLNSTHDTTSTQSSSVNLFMNPDSILLNSSTASIMSPSSSSEEYPLSATIASILHHLPIIRYEHLANALCRVYVTRGCNNVTSETFDSVSIQQRAQIIQHLGANAPATIPSLVRGCINAYHHAAAHTNNNSINNDSESTKLLTNNASLQTMISAEKSIIALSKLSHREASQIITMLKQSCVMPLVMISLMMECYGNNHDDTTALLITLLDDLICEKITNDKLRCSSSKYNKKKCTATATASSVSIHQWKRSLLQKHRKRKRISISCIVKNVKGSKPWIIGALKGSKSICTKIRQFLSTEIDFLVVELEQKSINRYVSDTFSVFGKVSLVLQVYSTLIHSVGIESYLSSSSVSTYVTTIMNRITKLCKKIQELTIKVSEKDSLMPSHSRADECIKMAISACLITCIKVLQIDGRSDADDSNISNHALFACTECLKTQLEWKTSEVSHDFVSRITCSIQQGHSIELKNVILNCIFQQNSNKCLINETNEDGGFIRLCEWASSIIAETNKDSALVPKSLTKFNISSCIGRIQSCPDHGKNYDTLISTLLNDADKCQQLFDVEGLFQMIITAATLITKRPAPVIPLVLPRNIEKLVIVSLKTMMKSSQVKRKLGCRLILNLVYAFTFLDNAPESPFAVQPISLPLKKLLIHLALMEQSQGIEIIKKFIMKYSPSSVIGCYDNMPLQFITSLRMSDYQSNTIVTAKDIGVAIRRRLRESDPFDVFAIERLFIYARAYDSSCSVDVEASIALLESVNDPVHFLTYKKLCEDPLILLKCSLRVWTDDGLRRIVLAIMERLLEANESLVMEKSVTPEVGLEYIVSRDAIVLRSWLVILSNTNVGNNSHQHSFQKSGIHCPLLVSMIRVMVVKRSGLVATLIKQLAPVEIVDWLIKFVPEIRSESKKLLEIMESGMLSVVERLHVADAALRVAIANPNFEAELMQLAVTSISILVNSFYIAVGPVDVPVNVISDQEGRDTTYSCRNYLFRMLSILKTIRYELPMIKNEARIALSKLAGLCKTDMNMGNISRKVFLKEIWDNIVIVNNSLGGGVQL